MLDWKKIIQNTQEAGSTPDLQSLRTTMEEYYDLQGYTFPGMIYCKSPLDMVLKGARILMAVDQTIARKRQVSTGVVDWSGAEHILKPNGFWLDRKQRIESLTFVARRIARKYGWDGTLLDTWDNRLTAAHLTKAGESTTIKYVALQRNMTAVSAWLYPWRRWSEYPGALDWIKSGPEYKPFYVNIFRRSLRGLLTFTWDRGCISPMHAFFVDACRNRGKGYDDDEYNKDGKYGDKDKHKRTDDIVLDTVQKVMMVVTSMVGCFVVPWPTYSHFSENDVWHKEDGPAAEWEDGAKLYALDGLLSPAKLFTGKGMTAIKIANLNNQEIRSRAMDVFGHDNFLEGLAANVIDETEQGVLVRLAYRVYGHRATYVLVDNSTPEPDGSVKKYALRVPNETRTVQGALAWTFGLDKAQYVPNVET